MDREAIVEFAERPRSEVTRLKTAYWRERKLRLGPGEGLRIGAELRRHMQARRPDWPSDGERAADLEVHARVGEALRSVAGLRSR